MNLDFNITGLVPYQVEQVLLGLGRGVEGARTEIAALRESIPAPLSMEQIRAALSSTGVTPLNVYQLLGGNTLAGMRSGTHAQRLALGIGSMGAGALYWETDRTALYGVVSGSWQLLGNLWLAATLSPDTKPSDLISTDAGFIIRSTDFDRLYRWSGSAWADAPGQSQRGAISYFPSAYAPTTGWSLCNNTAAVAISTPTGTTTTITTPDLTGANRFIRSVAGATGTTGGDAENHIHAVTGTNTDNDSTAGTVVQAGVGTTVAAKPHIHPLDVVTTAPTVPDDALPPYLELRPYIRL